MKEVFLYLFEEPTLEQTFKDMAQDIFSMGKNFPEKNFSMRCINDKNLIEITLDDKIL